MVNKSEELYTGRAPWLGIEITIREKGHALKGYTAVVKDVLTGQPTASGLRIAVLVPLLKYASNGHLTFDYDDVADAK